MFTNQKVLGILLIVFILGTGVYFAVSRLNQEVSSVSASPSPQPSALDFLFNKTPAPQQAQQQSQFPGFLKPEDLQNKKAVLKTSKGLIEFQVYPEATMAASNFLLLAANDFYDGLTFHRVEEWVVQGGDPTGTGRGGPGYQFPDEPVTRDYVKGVVAMANSGPNTNGSQFFILKKDTLLQPNYTIFGQVTLGQEVVDQLAVGDIMQKVTIQNVQ